MVLRKDDKIRFALWKTCVEIGLESRLGRGQESVLAVGEADLSFQNFFLPMTLAPTATMEKVTRRFFLWLKGPRKVCGFGLVLLEVGDGAL